MSDTKTSTTPAAPAAKTFADFGVDAAICDSLAAVGILSPFPIQEMTLPLALSGADIIGQARTGTGKTLGFGLPLLQRIDTDGALQALVIVPTRELCLQVSEDLAQAGKGRGVDVLAVYGGKAIQPQIDAIADGAHLVVGTPGRLLDLSRRGVLDLSQVAGLVLDEADEMLDLGFLPDVEALIEQCRDDRQTLLFSATMPAAIVGLARRYMTKPTFMRADVEEINIAPKTKQYFFSCHRMDKPAVVARILQTPDRGLCVIFCRTKRMADILAEELRDRDVAAQAIHSDLRQDAREKVMQKFRDGKVTVLCATEVAARGLDIDDVTHVVNYDCPDDEKMYLHRIGRTGRAGADGVAITFAVWNELPRLEMIRRELDITDEIHEVFSTSPLLDELFDLPAREERKKVPSPPQGRSSRSRKGEDDAGSRSKGKGRGGRSKDTRSKDDRPEDTQAQDTRTQDTQSARRAKSSAKSSAKDTAKDEDGAVRTRRRTRTRSGGGEATGRTSEPTSDETPAKPDTTGSRRADTDADERGGDQRRRRSRGGRGGDTETPSTRNAEASEADEDASTSARTRTRTRSERGGRDTAGTSEGRGRGRSEGTSGGRGRSEETSGGRSEETSDDRSSNRSKSRSGGRSEEKSPSQSEEKSGNRSEEKSGNRSEEKSGGRSGSSRSGEKSGRSRSGGGRGGSGGGSGRNSGGNGGRNSGGRGGGRSSGGNGGRSSSGRSSGNSGRSQKSPSVDHTEARGVGQPRLSRKLEVEHLP